MNLSFYFNYKNFFLKEKIKALELTFLSLFLLFLPSFEAPKNLFLVLYLIFALYRIFSSKFKKYDLWDLVFLSLIFSALLSAQFAGIVNGSEWKGLRGITLWVIFGWVISRINYKESEKLYLILFAVLSSLPTLIWGFFEVLISHTKEHLQLHSVGHFNHSAIYLTILFGITLSLILIKLQKELKYISYLLHIFFLILIFAIIYSFSRGGLYLAVIILTSYLFIFRSNFKTKVILFFAFITILFLSLFISHVPILQKQQDSLSGNATSFLSGRDRVWKSALEVSRIYPSFGVGNGNWSKINIEDIKSSVEQRGDVFNSKDFLLSVGHAHNIYLANLVERGFIGFFIFVNFMLFWAFTLFSSFRRSRKNSSELLIFAGSLSSFLAIFGIGFVNTTFHHENALLALFFLGLHLNYIRQRELNFFT